MGNQIKIYDTTLRDGAQSGEINLSIHDKLEIVCALDEFGVDYIELGWPGSNEKDMGCFLKASELELKNAKISAFGSTRRKGIAAAEDLNLQAVLKSKAKVSAIFGKTWIDHVEKQLKVTPEENRSAIKDSVKFLVDNDVEVFFDAEHYFDGYKDNKEYALNCLKAALDAGARCVVLCDTNGGCLTEEIVEITKETAKALDSVDIGIHCHNDSGLAVANTLAVSDIVKQIQVTVNGFGERAGNADLCQVVPSLKLKKGYDLGKINVGGLVKLSSLVYALANVKFNRSQPFVGRNAFRHKGGVHVDAIMKGASYEHIIPEDVGNSRGIILSELSGKANIVEIAKKHGIDVDKNDARVVAALTDVEELQKKGYNMGEIDAEQFLIVQKHFGEKKDMFSVKSWKVMSEVRGGEYSECVISGIVDGKERNVVATAEAGPVDAMYNALKRLLRRKYPKINDLKLVNYKVMIAEEKGAESSVRAYIEFKSNGAEWGTVGVNHNILEASFNAIQKGFMYYLMK